MKKAYIVIFCSLLTLLGCANTTPSVQHGVALSYDAERIAYNIYGSGKRTLVFIHGWSCDSRYWKEQIAVFSKDYTVITLDLAGHGNSSSTRADYTMLSFAHDIQAVITKEKIDNAILIGHSMGGSIIAEAARLMPKEVIGIIGVDTLQNVSEKLPEEVLANMATPFDVDFTHTMQGFVVGMFPKEVDKNLLYWVMEDMSSAPKNSAMNAFRNYLGQHVNGEITRVFEDVNVPLVSINARLWPTNVDGNKRHIKDYTLLYIENVGHFPMLEKSKECNVLLQKALRYIDQKKSQ